MPARAKSRRRRRWAAFSAPSRLALFLLPALLALLISLPALNGPMLWDDVLLIANDTFAHHLSNIPAAFQRTFWAALDSDSSRFDYYRPLVTVSYILNYAAADGWSGPYHLVNSALYALTAGLLALEAVELGVGAGAALAAGALFAVWPTHHENVDFISGRTDLMAALLLLLALVVYRRERARPRASPGELALLALCVGGAAFSKEVAYVAPAAFLIYEWAARARGRAPEPAAADGPSAEAAHAPGRPPARPTHALRRAALRLLAVTVPVLAAAALRQAALTGRASSHAAPPLAMGGTLLVNSRALLFPWPLYLNQRFSPNALLHPPLVVVLVWLQGVGLSLVFLRGRAERGAWVVVWMLAAPACTTGIPASRMLYLPTLVLLPLLTWKLSRLPRAPGLAAAACAVAVVLGAAGFLSAARVWNDPQRLFERLVREVPYDGSAHNDLAECYHHIAQQPGLPDSTRQRWLRLSAHENGHALQLDPTNALALFTLARTCVELGHDSLAVVAAKRGLAVRENAPARFLQAQALTRLGRYAEAESSVRRSMSTPQDRKDPQRWAELGWILFKQHRFRESVRATGTALGLDPTLGFAACNQALAWGAAGSLDSAASAYRATLAWVADSATAASALSDIAEFGAAGGAHAPELARVFLDAAGLRPGATGTLRPALRPALRQALEKAARTWPALRDAAGGTDGAR